MGAGAWVVDKTRLRFLLMFAWLTAGSEK